MHWLKREKSLKLMIEKKGGRRRSLFSFSPLSIYLFLFNPGSDREAGTRKGIASPHHEEERVKRERNCSKCKGGTGKESEENEREIRR